MRGEVHILVHCPIDTLQMLNELNVKSNSRTQIFWIAQVTLFKYLIISNDYFTMKGFTEKDAILVIFLANIVISK